MNKSASEIINNLEQRVARLEKQSANYGKRFARLNKKSSKRDDLELALAIKEYIEEYNNGDVEDLRVDPTYSVTMDEIENAFPRLKRTIKSWDQRGLLEYHSGSVERKSPGGFHLYDEDWDLTTLNRKGADLVLELLNSQMRVARLERQAKYDIEVQLVFNGSDVEMYFETEDESLADTVASHFERNWNEGRASVMLENSVDGWDGALVRVGATIKIRGVDTSGNNGYFNFMKKLKKFFDVVSKNGFKFDAVSSIKR